MDYNSTHRRRFIKNSAFGLIGVSSFGLVSGQNIYQQPNADTIFYRYPSIEDNMVSGIVGASHGNFEKVKQLVSARPELAGASWDWGFGDFETALGAASHVGRRDIAEYLMANGARPDLFTYAMMGMLKSVQEIIETVPGIQSNGGPHGITLLQHAKNRLEVKDISAADAANVNKVVSYLESVGNADRKPKSIDVTEEEKKMYVGEYRFGTGDNELFIVDTHRLGFIQIARKGISARKLNKVDKQTFSPAGAPSVKIVFTEKEGKAISLSIYEPQPLVTANRV